MEIIISIFGNPYAMGGIILGLLAIFLIKDGKIMSPPRKKR